MRKIHLITKELIKEFSPLPIVRVLKTTLTLNPDKTFSLHSVYIDRDSSFDEKGTYTLKDNLLTLNEEGGELSYYKVEENHLRKLTMDKQEITGELADHYVLNKE